VNCESDFVARTDDFHTLVDAVAEGLLAAPASADQASLIGADGPLGQKVAAAMSALGENMTVSRAARLDGEGLLGTYLHLGGRIGVLVEVTGVPADRRESAEAQTLLRELAMQIAAASPAYPSRAEIPAEAIEKEKSVYRAQMEGSGKPGAIIDRIVDGKLGNYYKEVVLPDQPSIRDQTITVAQVLADASKRIGGAVAVSRFVRFKVGEAA
jgi:elongation factor Ts